MKELLSKSALVLVKAFLVHNKASSNFNSVAFKKFCNVTVVFKKYRKLVIVNKVFIECINEEGNVSALHDIVINFF